MDSYSRDQLNRELMGLIGQAARRRMSRSSSQGEPSTNSPYGVSTTFSSRPPTPDEQQAHLNKRIFEAQYGEYGGKYGSKGLVHSQLENEKLKQALEAKQKAYENSLREREVAAKEMTARAKASGGEFGLGAGTEGVGTGVAGGQQPVQPRAASGQAIQPQPTQPAQTAQSQQEHPFPGTREEMPYGDMPRGSGRITVPQEAQRNDPNIKAGTWLMNPEGQTRRIYGQPKPSLGDDVNAYTPAEGSSIRQKPGVPATQAVPQVVSPGIENKRSGLLSSSPTWNAAGQVAADMFYRAPMNAIGRENLSAAGQTARDMFVSPITRALKIPEGQKEFRLEDAKKKRQALWEKMQGLSRSVLGGVR